MKTKDPEDFDTESMEEPCPCVHCGDWFDLQDGYGSDKWHKDTVICEKCYFQEEKEIERDDEIEMILDQLAESEWEIKNCKVRLQELGYKPEDLKS